MLQGPRTATTCTYTRDLQNTSPVTRPILQESDDRNLSILLAGTPPLNLPQAERLPTHSGQWCAYTTDSTLLIANARSTNRTPGA